MHSIGNLYINKRGGFCLFNKVICWLHICIDKTLPPELAGHWHNMIMWIEAVTWSCYAYNGNTLFRSATSRPLRVLWSVIHSLSQWSRCQWSRLHMLHVITSAMPTRTFAAATFIVAFNMLGSGPFTRVLWLFIMERLYSDKQCISQTVYRPHS